MTDMSKEEFNQIADEIEQNEELGIEENDLTEEELESMESEDEFDSPDDEEYEDDDDDNGDIIPDSVTETITIVKQPIVTQVIVGAEVDSKGQVKPMCKVSIERHLDPDEFGNGEVKIDEFDVIKNDFTELASEAYMQIVALQERMNPRK